MNNIYKIIVSSFLVTNSLNMSPNVNIDFEEAAGYVSLGVYDSWKDSPFMTGDLQGNWAITSNPDRTLENFSARLTNESEKVLGAQRSRHGSNLFGLRIDLEEPFQLSSDPQYVHVMIHKPKNGRVMLIGLGSRQERLKQNPFTEQFHVLSTNPVYKDKWYDAVFPVRGAEGVNIRSLVIVPDCESPHDLKEDFLFYIDNIILSDSPDALINNEYYPIYGDKETEKISGHDNYSIGVGIERESDTQEVKLDQVENKLIYQDNILKTLFAKAGEEVKPFINYNGESMHAYCYIDFNRNGNFDFSFNLPHPRNEYAEIVSFNYLDGKNSKGETMEDSNLGNKTGEMPSFVIPEDLPTGMYRMRFKIDRNCSDPLGNSDKNNFIADNGGMISDVMLFVYNNSVIINDNQLNGEVTAADGSKLNNFIAIPDADFTIKVIPEKGFYNGGIEIKSGYDLDEDFIDEIGNPRYVKYVVEPECFDSDNIFTIPAEWMRGNLLINGRMKESIDKSGRP